MSLILGPLVLAPVVVLAMAVTILVHSRARRRARCLIGVACPAALFLPLLAPPPGLTEAWFRFEDGAMILLPDAVSLNPGATLVLLLGAWLLSPFVSASLVARAVDARTGLERQRAAQLLVLWSLLPASG